MPARNSTEKGTDVANNAEQNRPSSTEENGPIDANVEDTEVHGTRAIRSKAHQNQSDTERLVSDGPAGIQVSCQVGCHVQLFLMTCIDQNSTCFAVSCLSFKVQGVC